jgi:hypothetical protein
LLLYFLSSSSLHSFNFTALTQALRNGERYKKWRVLSAQPQFKSRYDLHLMIFLPPSGRGSGVHPVASVVRIAMTRASIHS